jgi:hypothetical protein
MQRRIVIGLCDEGHIAVGLRMTPNGRNIWLQNRSCIVITLLHWLRGLNKTECLGKRHSWLNCTFYEHPHLDLCFSTGGPHTITIVKLHSALPIR